MIPGPDLCTQGPGPVFDGQPRFRNAIQWGVPPRTTGTVPQSCFDSRKLNRLAEDKQPFCFQIGPGETPVKLCRNILRSDSESGVPPHLKHNLELFSPGIPGSRSVFTRSSDPDILRFLTRFRQMDLRARGSSHTRSGKLSEGLEKGLAGQGGHICWKCLPVPRTAQRFRKAIGHARSIGPPFLHQSPHTLFCFRITAVPCRRGCLPPWALWSWKRRAPEPPER